MIRKRYTLFSHSTFSTSGKLTYGQVKLVKYLNRNACDDSHINFGMKYEEST